MPSFALLGRQRGFESRWGHRNKPALTSRSVRDAGPCRDDWNKSDRAPSGRCLPSVARGEHSRRLGVLKRFDSDPRLVHTAHEGRSLKLDLNTIFGPLQVMGMGMAAQRGAHEGRARVKSDVGDAEWIAQSLLHGLLAPSCIPPPGVRQQRILICYRWPEIAVSSSIVSPAPAPTE
jgi:hypothetical protein